MNDTRGILCVLMLCAAALTAGCAPEPVTKKEETPRPAAPAAKATPGPVRAVRPVQESAAAKAAAAQFAKLINAAETKVAAAKDVSCRLVRTEMVGNALQPQEVLDFRQRFSPHSLRLKWTGDRFRDRELIYVVGANGDKVLVKERGGLGGLLTGGRPMQLALDSPMVKGQSRYAPDVAGYNNLVKHLASIYREARPIGLAWVEASPVEASGVRRVQKFEVTLEPLLLSSGVSRMTVWFDLATSLPMRSVLYDAMGRMAEDYDWQDLKLNAGLTDADFRF